MAAYDGKNVHFAGDVGAYAVYVDPGSPTAWRREPYYSQLKAWARVPADRGTQIVVYIKSKAIAILPNKEVDLETYNVGA
jgi:hypothetical protein